MTPIPKTISSHQKGVKMKSTQAQPKKKIAMTKALNDSISDTISSVIQGKLAYQKAESKPTSPKKLVKNDKPKVIKKLSANTKKAVVASSSATCTPPKNDNANVTRAHNTKAEPQSSPKKQQEKPVKAATSTVKQLKPNVLSADVKSQIKPTNVVKRQNSPAKVVNTVTDKDKASTNVSKDTTKERVANKTDVPEKKHKQALLKKKLLAVNKAVKIKKKITANKNVKQKLVSKPKKVVQTAIKTGVVKKKILVAKSAALTKKIIRKITPKKTLPPKEDTTNSSKSTPSINTLINSNNSEKANTAAKSFLKEEQIKKEPLDDLNSTKLIKIKEEHDFDIDKKSPKTKALSKVKSKPNAMMVKRLLGNHSVKNAKQSKKMKLYNMWNGPKRHRVASLNALAKVHCLYENETRGVLLDQMIDSVKKENTGRIKSEDEAPPPSTRQLRNNPGSRGVGKHWEMHESCSSSSSPTSEEEDEYEFKETNEKPYLRKIRRIREPSKIKDKIKIDTNDSSDDTEAIVAPIKAKRPRKTKKKSNSPIMDLKDLIVPKRMASLNASAILAASYSMDKRSNRPPNSDSEDSTDSSDSYFKEPIPEDEQLEQIVKMEQQQAVDERNKLIDVRATPNSKKVAVILNQDTDVTITGVYVNSTRSTHHEGFCSIAGMQYRISATSHTQTAATAVTSETILQNEHSTTNSTGDSTTSTTVPAHPNKSYTPLDALSSMKPPSTSTTSSNPATNNGNNPPPTGQPAPQATQPTTHVNNSQPPKQHHPHSHHHHHHRQQQQHLSASPPAGGVGPLPHQQYHHHHHHVGGPPPPPPGHYHHPHQLVVAQYPHQYYPHQHSGPIKGRYGLYHHHGGGGHHHGPSASSVIDRAPSDSSAFSAPPGVSAFPVSSTSAGAVSTISSSASVVAASGIQPPLTVSQSSAGSGSESDGVGSGYVHGYYQPAGPLISLSHGHSQPAPLVKTQPVDPPPTSISPLPGLHKIQPPSSTGDSSDNEVIITSVTTIKDNSSSTTPSSRLSPTVALTHPSSSLPPPPPSAYRSPYHTPQPYAPPPPSAYSSYPPAYGSPYHSSYYSPYPPPNHHELCYPAPGGGYVTTTAHHKYPPPQSAVQASLAYRRYLNTASAGGAYYVTAAPEMFSGQGPGPGPGPGGQGGGDARAVAGGGSSGASSNGSVSYQIASPHHQSTPQSGSSHSSQPGQGLQPPGQPPTIIETYTPPPALLDPYPPPPPSSHYYPGYGPAAPPPPSCYSHPHPHSPSRGVPFLNATYPPCPCPMQSCPKNVHTGPLTGDCKRSTALQIAKATTLPPVALALPLEPASATGPPSPARGSAGMAPPPSPAGAMYQTLPLASTMSDLLPQLKNEQISDSESNTTTHHQTSAASEHHEQPQRPPRDDVTTVDFKPTEEKRRKARVGKAMVRNSIQQMQQMNHVVNNGSNVSTMLLMCNPPASNQTVVDQTTLIGIDVKREVESPEEVQHQHQEVRMIEKEKGCACVEELIVPEDLTTTKEPSVLSNGQIQVNQTSLESFPIEDVKTEKMIEVSSVTEVVKTIEILEPCQKTVAENVKVKNMKRKLSLNNNNNNVEEKKLVEESPTPAKKSKQNSQISINNNIPNNGSYKDLIKKGCSTVKMNNGRRKLITTNGGKLQSKLVPSKFPKKRTPVKRKAIVPLKDETNSKRVKLNPKPVAINNSKDSNHPAVKNNEVKENIENIVKSKAKNGRKNVNQSETIKTNVDRTIESVVMNSCSVARTEKPPPTRSRSRSNDTSKEHKDNEPAVGINKRSATKIVPTPPLISVTHVLIPSAVPSVESFLKPRPSVVMFPPSRAAAAVASTSKAASVISVVTTPKVVVGVVPTTGKSDVCASKAGTSKQSVVRKRKGVALTVGSVAAGTRSLKASAAVASVAVVAAAAAVVPRTGRRSLQHQQPRWSNGWTWEGVPFQREVFLNSDDAAVARKCYPAMRHREGDTIEPRDCVLLKAGPRKNDLPFVAKVAALWENPEDGEMMMSLLWYYRPEHTEQGRTCADQPDEVFASRHKDSNSVACIEDKCYVLTFNEYCRYRKNLKRLEDGLADTSPCIPLSEPYLRDCRQPPKSVPTSPEMIFFCRRVYDFRQKRIVKNPS